MDLSAKYTVPLADEDKGLGTGEADYSLQAELFTTVGAYSPFVTLARKFMGHLSEVALGNVWYTSVGSGYRLNDTSSIGVSLDYQQAAADRADAQTEIFGYFSHRLDNQWRGMVYAYFGLSDGSPDQGFGVQISYRPEKVDQVASMEAKKTMRADTRAEKQEMRTAERAEKAERPEKPQRPERPGK